MFKGKIYIAGQEQKASTNHTTYTQLHLGIILQCVIQVDFQGGKSKLASYRMCFLYNSASRSDKKKCFDNMPHLRHEKAAFLS